MRKLLIAGLASVFILLLQSPLQAQPSLNLDFEETSQYAPQPKGWFVWEYSSETRLDTAEARSGKQSLRVRSKKEEASGGANRLLSVRVAAGKRLRFAAYIKTENASVGATGLECVVFRENGETAGDDGIIARANLKDRRR